MGTFRTAAIVCITLLPFSGAAATAQREPCEISVNSRNVATCVLPKANARLECDRSIGQPLPQCITEDGRFADCVYGQIVAGGPPGIFCQAPPKDQSEGAKRIVITDGRFGRPKEAVSANRRSAAADSIAPSAVGLPPLPEVLSAPARPRLDIDTELRRCRDEHHRIVTLATQSWNQRGSVVISQAKAMERACVPPRGLGRDELQQRSFCDGVSGLVSSLAEQWPTNRTSIMDAMQRVIANACGG